jgi:hypothetical protein
MDIWTERARIALQLRRFQKEGPVLQVRPYNTPFYLRRGASSKYYWKFIIDQSRPTSQPRLDLSHPFATYLGKDLFETQAFV